ncbi:hypothetical protein FRB99_003424 [Tulasnella sp. 403]|nr:hypothetical protein FRB99_003424 [Tulasnella sp. 403]
MDDNQQPNYSHSSSLRSDAIDDEILEDTEVIPTPLGEKEATRVSIQQLPLELFTQILRIILEESCHSSECFKQLCLVCNDWYQTILSTSELWTVINDTEPLAHLKNALRLSGNAPLNILLTGRLMQLVDLLIPHSNRWKSLEIYRFTRLQRNRFTSLLAATTPSLAHLSLSTNHHLEDILTLGEGVVRANDIAFEQNPAPSKSITLSGDPSRLAKPYRASLAEMAQLALNVIGPFGTPTSTYLPPLDACSTLALDNLTDPDCGLFHAGNSGFASLSSQIITAQNYLNINVHATGLMLSAMGTDGVFHLTIQNADPCHSLSVIATFIVLLDLKVRLSVEMWASVETFGPLPVGVLDVLPPTVEKLVISGEYKYLLEYLARPKRGPAGVYEWPCPSLRDLECGVEDFDEEKTLDVDAVRRFLSGRWDKTNLPEDVEPKDYQYPRKFDNLSFTGFTSEPAEMQTILQTLHEIRE